MVYRFDGEEFYLSQATALEKRIFLSLRDIELLNTRVNEIPFDSETEKTFFKQKSEFIINSLVFSSNQEKLEFIDAFLDENVIFTSIQKSPTSGQIKQEEQGYLEVVENIHYVGKNSGFQKIYYDLGRGNTFDKILIYQKELPPPEYFDRYKDIDCDEAWASYPLPETHLPERPYQDNPSKSTYDFRTDGFLRENSFMYNYFNFYPHEYDIKVIVKSHFCANIRKTPWDLIRLGKMNQNQFYPVEGGQVKPIVRDDIVYLGAVSSKNYKINFNLGMGNTKDKMEILYKDKPLSFKWFVDNVLQGENVTSIEHNPRTSGWNSLKGHLILEWMPGDFDNKVVIRISSSQP